LKHVTAVGCGAGFGVGGRVGRLEYRGVVVFTCEFGFGAVVWGAVVNAGGDVGGAVVVVGGAVVVVVVGSAVVVNGARVEVVEF
jgi:hypothetical protein